VSALRGNIIRRALMDWWIEVLAINFSGYLNAILKRLKRRLMTWRTGIGLVALSRFLVRKF